MTVDEIMALIDAYGEDRFYRRFNGRSIFLALQEAIHQVVGERDDALAGLADYARDILKLEKSLEELTAKRNEALVASGTGFRKEVADALGLIDATEEETLKWIAGIRADGAEDDRQLAVSRADCSRMYEQRAAARAECLERTEERDVALAECLRLRSVRAELERLVGSL